MTPNSTSRDGSGYTKETASPLVSTNLYHSVALKYDGTVYAWGRNDYGQVSTKRPLKTAFRIHLYRFTVLNMMLKEMHSILYLKT